MPDSVPTPAEPPAMAGVPDEPVGISAPGIA